jgi:Fe-Mn family superoxide dismutase
MNYTPHTFTIPTITGISQKQIDVHLALYAGYVKNINLLREQIAELTALDPVKYAFAIESTRRRLGFEFNGMRMHEFYFPQLEGGSVARTESHPLWSTLSEKYGSPDAAIAHITQVAMSRGSGWAVLAYDKAGKTPHVFWTADHELGTLADVSVLFALDVWEHAYMVDYVPAEKAQHVAAYLAATNWSVVEKRFEALS